MFEIHVDRKLQTLYLVEASSVDSFSLESITKRYSEAEDVVSPWDAELLTSYYGYKKTFSADLMHLLATTNPRDPVNWCIGWSVINNQFMEEMNPLKVLRALEKDYLLQLNWRHTDVYHYTSPESAAKILSQGFKVYGTGKSSFMDGLYFYREPKGERPGITLLHSIALGVPWFQCLLGNDEEEQVGECVLPFDYADLRWEVVA